MDLIQRPQHCLIADAVSDRVLGTCSLYGLLQIQLPLTLFCAVLQGFHGIALLFALTILGGLRNQTAVLFPWLEIPLSPLLDNVILMLKVRFYGEFG